MFQGAVADSLTVADEGLKDPVGQHVAALGELVMLADDGLCDDGVSDEYQGCDAGDCSGDVQTRVT